MLLAAQAHDNPSVAGGRLTHAGSAAARQDSTEACSRWGAQYQRCVRAVAACAPQQPWSFDAAPIFAHVDAFVQRCRCAVMLSMWQGVCGLS